MDIEQDRRDRELYLSAHFGCQRHIRIYNSDNDLIYKGLCGKPVSYGYAHCAEHVFS